MLFCQECLRWKELKLHLAFSAAPHLLSVEPGLLPGGQHGTFTTSSPRHALCSVHTVCLHADFALYQVGFISSNSSEFSGLPVSAKFVPVLFRMTNTAKMQQWFHRLEFRQRNCCESEGITLDLPFLTNFWNKTRFANRQTKERQLTPSPECRISDPAPAFENRRHPYHFFSFSHFLV